MSYMLVQRMMWHPERERERGIKNLGVRVLARFIFLWVLDHSISLYKEHSPSVSSYFWTSTSSSPRKAQKEKQNSIASEVKMKKSRATVEGSKKKMSCRRLGGYLREQKGRLYIIRRCIVMLVCWHD